MQESHLNLYPTIYLLYSKSRFGAKPELTLSDIDIWLWKYAYDNCDNNRNNYVEATRLMHACSLVDLYIRFAKRKMRISTSRRRNFSHPHLRIHFPTFFLFPFFLELVSNPSATIFSLYSTLNTIMEIYSRLVHFERNENKFDSISCLIFHSVISCAQR